MRLLEVPASNESGWFFARRLVESGMRSLMVRHTVHLKTLSSFGHRTVESHVMHFPVINSRSMALDDLVFCAVFAGPFDEVKEDPSAGATSFAMAADDPSRFFLLWNIGGNGWLIDLPCLEGCCSPSPSRA